MTRQRKPIKRVSRSKARQYTAYYEQTAAFLALNPRCLICTASGHRPPRRATEVHHVYLRTGSRLLLDQRGWLPSCRHCREVPHTAPCWAESAGILAPGVARGSWKHLHAAALSNTLPVMLRRTTVNAEEHLTGGPGAPNPKQTRPAG